MSGPDQGIDFIATHADVDHVKADELFAQIKTIKDGVIVYVDHHGKVESRLVAATSFVQSKVVARQQRIKRAPGTQLDVFASFLFKKRVYETVLKPLLAEMQEEYFEALSKGETCKAQWVSIRGVFDFWSTVALQLPVSLTRLVKRLWIISGG